MPAPLRVRERGGNSTAAAAAPAADVAILERDGRTAGAQPSDGERYEAAPTDGHRRAKREGAAGGRGGGSTQGGAARRAYDQPPCVSFVKKIMAAPNAPTSSVAVPVFRSLKLMANPWLARV